MKKIIYLIIFCMLASLTTGSLGIYEEGNNVTYTVVCLTDDGYKDTGCSGNDDDILDPDDTSAKSPTSAMAEVSDANFPGLWRGYYVVPANPDIGTWSIFIELTNINSTTGATTLTFEVVESKWSTPENISTLSTHGDSTWPTATGFETETSAVARQAALKTNFTNVSGNFESVISTGNSKWTTASTSTLATITHITDIQKNMSSYNVSLTDRIETVPTTIGANLNASHGDDNWSLTADLTDLKNVTTMVQNISDEINAPYTAGTETGLLSRIIKYLLQELQGMLGW